MELQVWYSEWEMNGIYVGVTGVVYRMGDEREIYGSYRCGIQSGRLMGYRWELQAWYTEWEMKGRYVGVSGVVYKMEDEGRYVGVTGVVFRVRDY